MVVSACGSSAITTPTPAPPPTPSAPPRATPPTIVLTGQVIDAITSAPIAGAAVSINGRYATVADGAGNYSVTGLLDAGSNTDVTYVSANNYASDYRYIRSTPHNVRLFRIERITAGESKLVTVAPDDTLCVNNMQDTPGVGQDYVCRSVRVVAPTDGVITIEAVSTQTGTHPPLEAETAGVQPCCSERMGNPTSVQVRSGTEVVVSIEILFGSATNQTFTLKTSVTGQ